MTRHVDFFFEADSGEVYVEVEASYMPDEPDVGIVGGWNMESYEVSDADGKVVDLSESEEKRLLLKIDQKLADLDPYYLIDD